MLRRAMLALLAMQRFFLVTLWALFCISILRAEVPSDDRARELHRLLNENVQLRNQAASAFISEHGLLDLLDENAFGEPRRDTLIKLIAMTPSDPEIQKQIALRKLLYVMGGMPNLPLPAYKHPLFSAKLLKILQDPVKLALANSLPLLFMPNKHQRTIDSSRLSESLSFPIERLLKIVGDIYIEAYLAGETDALSRDLMLWNCLFFDPIQEFSRRDPSYAIALIKAFVQHPKGNSVTSLYRTLHDLPLHQRHAVYRGAPELREFVENTLMDPFRSLEAAGEAFQLLLHNEIVTSDLIDDTIETKLRNILEISANEVMAKLPDPAPDAAGLRGFYFNEVKASALMVLMLAQKNGRILNSDTLRAVEPYLKTTKEDVFIAGASAGFTAASFIAHATSIVSTARASGCEAEAVLQP